MCCGGSKTGTVSAAWTKCNTCSRLIRINNVSTQKPECYNLTSNWGPLQTSWSCKGWPLPCSHGNMAVAQWGWQQLEVDRPGNRRHTHTHTQIILSRCQHDHRSQSSSGTSVLRHAWSSFLHAERSVLRRIRLEDRHTELIYVLNSTFLHRLMAHMGRYVYKSKPPAFVDASHVIKAGQTPP